MKDQLKTLTSKITPYINLVRHHTIFVAIVCVLAIFSFLVLQINAYNTAEPSEDAIAEKLLEVKRPKVDESSIDAFEQLKEADIEIKTLFEQARDNPFLD